MRYLAIVLLASVALVACGQGRNDGNHGDNAIISSAAAAPFAWPGDLKVVGDGFPQAGDPCRVIGETAATSDFLDDSATLAGCPTSGQAAALGGRVVGTVSGVTLVSVPRRSTAASGDGDSQPDSKVAGTNYNATADIPCSGVKGGGPTCKAGVTRSPEQIAVEVIIPAGIRTLLFDAKGNFVTHSSSDADGSAALRSSSRREDDWQVITVGTEIYRVPDAFVLGD